MRTRTLLYTLLLLTPLTGWGQRRASKAKAAPINVAQQLSEATAAYDSYQFQRALSLLEHLTSGRAKLSGEERNQVESLQARVERAERMYASPEVLHVVDSAMIDRSELLKLLPQGEGKVVAGPTQDSLSSFPALAFVDGLGRTRISYDPASKRLTWASRIGDRWEPQPVDTRPLKLDAQAVYPFLLEDGQIILYGTESDRGLGGVDLYMSRLNESGSSFLEPTLLAMPYNSPANDYLLTYHEGEQWGVLVSDRNLPPESNQVHLYIFTGRPAFLSDRPASEEAAEELTSEERYRRATLTGVLYSDDREEKPYALGQASDQEAEDYGQESMPPLEIQSGRTYYMWSDFHNPRALAAYRTALTQIRSLQEMRTALQSARQRWGTTADADRADLRSEILRLEATIPAREKALTQALNEVRRLEGVQ